FDGVRWLFRVSSRFAFVARCRAPPVAPLLLAGATMAKAARFAITDPSRFGALARGLDQATADRILGRTHSRVPNSHVAELHKSGKAPSLAGLRPLKAHLIAGPQIHAAVVRACGTRAVRSGRLLGEHEVELQLEVFESRLRNET